MAATLTITNKRVQFFLTHTTERPTTSLKKQRLKQLEETLEARNIMLDELFPSKQLAVLDYLIYITSASGIAKVGADRIAEACGCSVRTVYSAIKTIKSTGEYVIARLIKTKGGAGKYVVVDKKHANYREIMREVFMLSDVKIAQLNAEQIAEQKNSGNVDTVGIEANNQCPNSIIFYTKHAKHNIYTAAASIVNEKEAIQEEIEKNSNNTREYLVEYASNPLQIALYDVLEGLPLPKELQDVKTLLALRMGSNSTVKEFVKAKDLIIEMANRINDGYVYENVVAAFTAGLTKSLQYEVPQKIEKEVKSSRKVPFYNWLTNRG